MTSKMHFALAAMVLVAAAALPQAAGADTWRARHKNHTRLGQAPVFQYQDSCGCLTMTFEYHREMKYTYGAHVDPRSFDQTEPYYYYGAVKAYPRYWSTRMAQP
jgi:hypothetical protein